MMKLFAVALAAVLWSSAGWADEEQRPLLLREVYEALGKLVEDGGGERTIESLSIEIAPLGAGPLLVDSFQNETDAEGRTRLWILANTGKCKGAVKKKFLKDFGFYIIEFCENPMKVYHPWGDFHRLADGSGSLGSLLGTQEFDCDIPVDFLTMPPAVQNQLCP